MIFLPEELRARLIANALGHRVAADAGNPAPDPVPLLKLFNPAGSATWLASELGEDGDVLFGLADLGFGCPELGYFSLHEIAAVRLPFGLRIERDLYFASDRPLSVWAETARKTGSIMQADFAFRCAAASQLPRP